MRRRSGSVAAAALAALAVAVPAAQAADPLNAYRVKPTAENKQKLADAGFDMTEADRGTHLEVIARRGQVRALARDGVAAKQLTQEKALAAPGDYTGSDADYDVWTRYDKVDDGKEQYIEQYERIAQEPIAKLVPLAPKTHLDRTIYALKITKDAKTTPDNSRPAVLFNAQQHAREWLAGETCRRTLDFIVDNYGRTGTAVDTNGDEVAGISADEITDLVDSREIWFMCISNPDGYEYTFTEGNRLWRKNMSDNNGNGIYGEPGDGVDPNRNYATNFRRDEEGASDDPASETYRGTAGDSEPETRAMKSLWDMVDFTFLKNDHTAAELLLYPQGFQQYTPTPDNGIFEALAGDDDDSAIADKVWNEETEEWDITGNRFDPDLSAELYITNGDELDDAYHSHGILGFTPEGSESHLENVSGFEYEDDEESIEAEFRRHLPFSIDLIESAAHPGDPTSHLGNEVSDFYVHEFADSYGDPQPVEATVKRSLGDVRLKYRINNGKIQQAPTKEAPGGERFNNDPGVVFHRVRGEVKGTQPGDVVDVWFAAQDGSSSSKHFSYTARSESKAKVLILSAENYSGPTPTQDPDGPHYLSYYTDALDQIGVRYDVYNVDAMDNESPDFLGVLSHYDAVIWYTGDDYLTRKAGQVPGTGTARLAVEEMIDVRAFLNEGGKLIYTGKQAGQQYAEGNEFRNFGFPEPDEGAGGTYCNANGTEGLPEFDADDPSAADGCIAHNDDFLQYYLGAYVRATPGNTFDDQAGHPYDLAGSGPFAGLSWGFDATGAGNQDTSATFVVTSSILPPDQFPLYASSRSGATWLRPGAAPFSPFSGTQYMAAGADSRGYKRLTQTFDLSNATAPQLSFKFSSDLEENWDFFAVEARTPGQDDWTTLPDVGGLTTTETGDSCPEGLASDSDAPHPFLQHYWNADCTPVEGKWHGFTGSTGGWTDFTVDLSDYVGQEVELSLSVITDWGTLGLGTWVDDVKVTDGATTIASTDFEADQGGWAVTDPPEGSDPLSRNWTRRGQEFQEGGVVTTDDSVYTGFGFEGIAAAKRAAFMKRALQHLGVVKDNPSQGNPVPGQGGNPAAGKHAKVKLKSGKRLRVNRKGKVRLRVNCAGDAGSSCTGKVKLKRSKRTLGAKRFTIAAGKTATVTVKLKKSAFKALKRAKRGKKVTVAISGKDAAGASIAAKQTIRLLRPKRR